MEFGIIENDVGKCAADIDPKPLHALLQMIIQMMQVLIAQPDPLPGFLWGSRVAGRLTRNDHRTAAGLHTCSNTRIQLPPRNLPMSCAVKPSLKRPLVMFGKSASERIPSG